MFGLKCMETNRMGCCGFTEKLCLLHFIKSYFQFQCKTKSFQMIVIIIIVKTMTMLWNACMCIIRNITLWLWSTERFIEMPEFKEQTETVTGNLFITIANCADNQDVVNTRFLSRY